MKTIVKVPVTMDRRKKTWRKELKNVDTTKTNGYAFVGEWLQAGELSELEVGSYILSYDEDGSMKNWTPVIRVHKVMTDQLEEVYRYDGDRREKSWALAVRDEIAELINNEEKDNPLASYTTKELEDELKRREAKQ